MDGQLRFPIQQTLPGFQDRISDNFGRLISKQYKISRVGLPHHFDALITLRQYFHRGVFKRVIFSGGMD